MVGNLWDKAGGPLAQGVGCNKRSKRLVLGDSLDLTYANDIGVEEEQNVAGCACRSLSFSFAAEAHTNWGSH